MYILKNKTLFTIIILTIFSFNTSAQNLPPFFDPEVDDTENAPISGLVIAGLITGGLIGCWKLKKEHD